MRVCAFLWTYYGYPNSNYEGINVEVMRNRNGALLAKTDKENGSAQDIDYVSGVPDSGTPTPSAMPTRAASPLPAPLSSTPPTWPPQLHAHQPEGAGSGGQNEADPRPRAHRGQKLLFVDDSIVRGTQLRRRWSSSTPTAPRRSTSVLPAPHYVWL